MVCLDFTCFSVFLCVFVVERVYIRRGGVFSLGGGAFCTVLLFLSVVSVVCWSFLALRCKWLFLLFTTEM